jgi:Uncharacterized protein conserved in bacteria
MSKSLHELEVKVAFLEESLSQLSDEFYRQQKELDVLKSNYISVINKLRSLQDGDSASTEVLDEKPPHY